MVGAIGASYIETCVTVALEASRNGTHFLVDRWSFPTYSLYRVETLLLVAEWARVHVRLEHDPTLHVVMI